MKAEILEREKTGETIVGDRGTETDEEVEVEVEVDADVDADVALDVAVIAAGDDSNCICS